MSKGLSPTTAAGQGTLPRHRAVRDPRGKGQSGTSSAELCREEPLQKPAFLSPVRRCLSTRLTGLAERSLSRTFPRFPILRSTQTPSVGFILAANTHEINTSCAKKN